MARSREERKERRKVSARRRVEAHANEATSRYLKLPEGLSFFKVDKSGVRLIDVMPYLTKVASKYAEAGEPYFEKTFFTHRGIGPNQDMVICPAKTLNKPCPICEHRAKLAKDPNADEDEIKALAPKERQLWLVRDRQAPDKGLMVWDVSPYLFGNLLESRIANADEDEDWDAFADLEEGCSLRLTFKEETFAGNKFYNCDSIDFKTRREQYSDSDLDDHPCLDDLLVVKKYEDLKKLFLQVADGSDEDEDEPAPTTRSKSKTKAKPEPVDDEDDWDDEPAPKAKSKSKRPPVDDDDDEPAPKAKTKAKPEPIDDDDDWDDEPAPKAKTNAASKAKVVEDDEWEDVVDDEDDWDDEPTPKANPKSTRKPTKSRPSRDEDDEEEETPKPRRKSRTSDSGDDTETPPKKGKSAKTSKEDDWDDDWD